MAGLRVPCYLKKGIGRHGQLYGERFRAAMIFPYSQGKMSKFSDVFE